MNRSASTTSRLRVGVVGLGGIGRKHAHAYAADERVELVAVSDTDAPRLADLAGELGVEGTYHDADELFAADLDAVSIAVPNHLHEPLAVAAFEAGLHVLCEKPLARTAAEARRIADAAARAERQLMIGYSFRYVAASQALYDLVATGALGEVYAARSIWHRSRGIPGQDVLRPAKWFTNREHAGGGPLIDLGVHRLDLALWLMGYPPVATVSAATYDRLGKASVAERQLDEFGVEDLAVAFIRFGSGATLTLEASWAINRPEEELMQTWLYGDRRGALQTSVDDTYRFSAHLYGPDAAGSFLSTTVRPGSRHTTSAYAEFITQILSGEPAGDHAGEAVAVMEIIDAIYRSAQLGREVAIGDS